jgi:pimeloyl-ACP methyl ester carboxylesterase
MMRLLTIGAVALVAVAAAGVTGIDLYYLNQIRSYTPVSLEEPHQDDHLIGEFALEGRASPTDFGYPNWTLERYRSAWDDVALEGWFIPASDSTARRALVFAHGRWSNRLKPLGYLPLLRETGLDSLYHVFLPDLRNSGGSEPAETGLGYEFAEDLYFTLRHLHSQYGIDRFVIYGFSMGGMATAVLLDRPDIQAEMDALGIAIERVVLDSPLSNVEASIYQEATEQGLPGPMTDLALFSFDLTLDGYLERMRLGTLLADPPCPVLILQGEADRLTSPAQLAAEQASFHPTVTVHTFPDGNHVKLYRNPQHRARYTELVAGFLRPSRP